MFNNIGEKLKRIAKIAGFIECFAGLIHLIMLITNEEFMERFEYVAEGDLTAIYTLTGAFTTIGIGILICYLIYGFGILVENSEASLVLDVKRDMDNKKED